jgi:hypothetical protein
MPSPSTGTFETIASIVLTQGLQEISFSNLPQNYQTLVLNFHGDFTYSSQSYLRFIINGSNTGQYRISSYVGILLLPGSGTAAVSWQQQNNTGLGFAQITPDASTRSLSSEMTLINYSRPTGWKAVLFDSRMNGGGGGYGGPEISSLTYDGPIRDFKLRFDNGLFSVGSSFTLYGLSAHQLKATGGDVITSSGNYWYHTFKTSGTFTPVANMTAEVLVVAGGGGGGFGKGGGGGAGGLVHHSSKSLLAGVSYTATIGAGGIGDLYVNGTNGSNTVFDNITAIGGGGGGTDYNPPTTKNGSAGGSGGGASRNGTVGATTQGNSGGGTGYGFAGGAGSEGVNAIFAGGGGGGAGQAGQVPTASGTRVAGKGGDGKNTWSTTTSFAHVDADGGYLAGGGGGSAYASGVNVDGGEGGRGAGGSGASYDTGANTNKGNDGVANFGAGGGGGTDNAAGGNGGSGIVIVRYEV